MKKPELKNINKMAYPILLNYLLTSVFEILDKAVVGHYSVRGFAVVGIAEAPVYEITGALGILSAAFHMIAAELQGKKDQEAFEDAFDMSRKISLAVGCSFFLLSLAGGRFFFQRVYKVEGEALEELLSYFYPAAFTVLQNMLLFLYSAYYRNRLNTRISFYSTAAAAIVNLFFDASLVYGLFGFPRLSTAGAAWGSVIGLFAGLLVYQVPYCKHKKKRTVSRAEKKKILKKFAALYPAWLQGWVPGRWRYTACLLRLETRSNFRSMLMPQRRRLMPFRRRRQAGWIRRNDTLRLDGISPPELSSV